MKTNRSEEGMPPADDTGGREARSPATAAAARARRSRLIRDRYGLSELSVDMRRSPASNFNFKFLSNGNFR